MDIKKVKERLNTLGFGPLDPENINLGPNTTAAIKNFQLKNGLEPDGIIGPLSLAKLFPVDQVGKDDNTKLKPWKATADTLGARAVQIAYSQNGVREKTGKNDGQAVEIFLKSVNLGAGYSWCMAFVYWCVQQAAAELGLPNPLKKTGGCLAQWNATPEDKRSKAPVPNSIFILDLGGGSGHTGFCTSAGYRMNTVEGNTNDDGSANGNGVYIRDRSEAKVKGFILL